MELEGGPPVDANDAPAFVTQPPEPEDVEPEPEPTPVPDSRPVPDPSVSVDAELDELQRRYRIMEGDRKSYAEEVQAVVRKQKAQIEKLKRENGQLKQELSLQSRAVALGDSGAVSTRITKLQDTIDLITRSIESEKKRVRTLVEPPAALSLSQPLTVTRR